VEKQQIKKKLRESDVKEVIDLNLSDEEDKEEYVTPRSPGGDANNNESEMDKRNGHLAVSASPVRGAGGSTKEIELSDDSESDSEVEVKSGRVTMGWKEGGEIGRSGGNGSVERSAQDICEGDEEGVRQETGMMSPGKSSVCRDLPPEAERPRHESGRGEGEEEDDESLLLHILPLAQGKRTSISNKGEGRIRHSPAACPTHTTRLLCSANNVNAAERKKLKCKLLSASIRRLAARRAEKILGKRNCEAELMMVLKYNQLQG